METQNVKMVYKLTDVNINEKTGKLIVRKEHGKKETVLDVSISGKLAYRIKKQREDDRRMKYEEVEFKSDVFSKSFTENPLKLVEFRHPDESVDGYKVELVDQAGIDFIESKDFFNRTIRKVVYKTWKPENYMRYHIAYLKS